MKGIRFMLLAATALTGCETSRDVASTSFNVVTAPVRFVHHHIFGEEEEPPPPPAPAATSDVVTTPGQPVAVTSPTPARRSVASTRTKSKTTTTSQSQPSPSVRTASTGQTEFPTAKPVPGRPGLVYNPFDPNAGYIDVSGYAPGSKVKDPDSKKIFIVP
ncbi:MAG: hypothetical protein ABR514_01625 [Chthoniobacterales bacterium]